MWQCSGEEPREPFDQELADSFVGKYILVGISHREEGVVVSREQLHGVIVSAAPGGITVSLRGVHEGKFWVMPPAVDRLEEASPGAYTLHSTGEIVDDPDLLATWHMDEAVAQ